MLCQQLKLVVIKELASHVECFQYLLGHSQYRSLFLCHWVQHPWDYCSPHTQNGSDIFALVIYKHCQEVLWFLSFHKSQKHNEFLQCSGSLEAAQKILYCSRKLQLFSYCTKKPIVVKIHNSTTGNNKMKSHS